MPQGAYVAAGRVVGVPPEVPLHAGHEVVDDALRLGHLGKPDRPVGPAQQIVLVARRLGCDLLILGATDESGAGSAPGLDFPALARTAPCPVCLVAMPLIPHEVAE